jgi:hypothetical protein
MNFYFPESCDTAIQLDAFSDKLLSLSEFEDEREVLVFPMISFRVNTIDIDEKNGVYSNHLKNIPSTFSIINLIMTFSYVLKP